MGNKQSELENYQSVAKINQCQRDGLPYHTYTRTCMMVWAVGMRWRVTSAFVDVERVVVDVGREGNGHETNPVVVGMAESLMDARRSR